MTMTPWGYTVAGSLTDLMTVAEFNALTANRWASDPMLETTLAAASQAIRDYCGWHVAPAAVCVAGCYGGGRLLHLPFRGIQGNVTVTVGGETLDSSCYAMDPRGMGSVYRTDGCCWPTLDRAPVTVTATAGYDVSTLPLVAQVLVQLVGSSLTAPIGVKEEHAGQVGITYNAPGGIAGGITLTDRDMACLNPYRVEEVA